MIVWTHQAGEILKSQEESMEPAIELTLLLAANICLRIG